MSYDRYNPDERTPLYMITDSWINAGEASDATLAELRDRLVRLLFAVNYVLHVDQKALDKLAEVYDEVK